MTENSQRGKFYRPDIDGLRAVAVCLVLAYHLDVKAFSGGFIGVDVFFVISGFLITGIILRDIKRDEFSVVNFYVRRFRRILPTLIVVTISTLAAGYLFLSPDDYLHLAKSAAYTSLSMPNVFFFWNTGYFDQASELMPLLHMWSLGVEEQFYMVWPLVILVLAKINRRAASLALAILIVGTFWLGLFELKRGAFKAAFFLPHTRAWELAAGALLAVSPIRISSRWMSASLTTIGIVMIFISSISLSAEMQFPGFAAMPPVLGAALVIVGGYAGSSGISRLLASPLLVKMGLISYSLYLWHWPIIVFWRQYHNGKPLTSVDATAISALAIAIAFLSWKFVETPARNFRGSPGIVFSAGGLGLCSILMACLPIYLTDGASERFSATIKPLLSRHEMWWQWRCPMADPAPAVETFLGRADCVFGTEWQRSKIKAVLWGNSHAEHLTPIVEIAAMESDASVALWPASCLPFVGKDGVKMMWNGDPIHMSEKCGSARDQFISKLDEHPEISVVILAANWAAADGRLYREDLVERNTRSMEFLKQGLQELVDRISRPGRRVILVGDVPFNGLDLRACFLAESGPLLRERCPDRYNISRAQFDHYNKAADEILKSIKGAEAVILGDRMCGPTMCETVVRGEFLYRDNDHWRRNLTEETNRELSLRLGIRQSIFQPLAAS